MDFKLLDENNNQISERNLSQRPLSPINKKDNEYIYMNEANKMYPDLKNTV